MNDADRTGIVAAVDGGEKLAALCGSFTSPE